METLESLSGKLETTGDIQSIVRTMKSLSAVSIRKFEQAEKAVTQYERTIDLGLTALLLHRRARGLPLRMATAPASGKEALIAIGSDRGLCGRYNEIAAHQARARLGEEPAVLAVLGLRLAARLQAAGHRVDHAFPLPGTVAGMSPLVNSVIIEIERWTRDAGIGRIRLVHNRREGRARAVPAERNLLPIPETYLSELLSADWPGRGRPFFRMDIERMTSWMIRQRLFVVLYRALAEALASEHATRLAAMQSAESNIAERREELTWLYRQTRQETITRELMDLVSGFEAVSSSDM
ncbi:F0F1 ATP synthase subunit gamma [Jannaschia seohaensis]|uniref:F-type H+-transporting ATPase subunit gamma n=1 Tax=Jannaschia seohaensis TaxID=475081 RepID=A0A2Y9B767_9RHOB|nr:F0F1 ATP synthase subunit gamma [Jannaschia seohaensis]PWJ09791.1 F-type H+-transporting ATPase subunit gamma [Jannaschia seohaensis]SSA51945.1 F-type H+-transporting ATPase subunit gamma [Jannaschia seohaensis]